MSVIKRGYNGKIYFNTGSYGSPTWTEITNVSEAKVAASFDKTEATTRVGQGLKQYHPTLFDPMLSGKIRSDDSDTAGYVYLETATFSRGIIDVLLLDGDKATNGSRGIRYDANNFKWDESQGNDEVMFREFELSPAISANPAKLAIVAGGVPVFTQIGP